MAASITVFLYMLYAGLDRWAGDGWNAIWMLMPGASLVAAIVLANKTDGGVALPVSGTVVMFALTVALAEWLRRRGQGRHDGREPSDQ